MELMQELRKDILTAQKVDIGTVFKHMLGDEDAKAYLSAENVPAPVIDRVLAGAKTRSQGPAESPAAAPQQLPDLHNAFYCHSGRRRDTVKAAVVEAALRVGSQLGRDRAERLLRKEGLPEEVISRVLSQGGTLRARRA